MTINEILDKITEGLGGIDRLRRFRSIKTSGSMQVGDLAGTMSAATEIGTYRKYTSADLSIHHQSSGFDGRIIWTDENGKRNIQTSPEKIAEVIASEKSGTYDYLINRDRYSFEIIEIDGQITFDVISIEHANKRFGRKRIILDDTGSRISAYEEYEDGGSSRTELTEYKEFDGLMYPTVLTSYYSDGDVVIISLDTVEIDGLIDDDLFSEPVNDKQRYQILSERNIEPIPLSIPLDHIFINVEIMGRGFKFVLDTGADKTVIADDLIEQLGLTRYGTLSSQGTNGRQATELTMLPELVIGHVKLMDLNVSAIDFTALRGSLSGISGILGLDFFSNFVVKLDYIRQEMTLFERDEFNGEYDACFPLDHNTVEMRIEGHQGKFKIDTGSGRIHLHSWFVKHGKFMEGCDLPSSTAIVGIGEDLLTEYKAIGREIALGNFVVADPPLSLATIQTGAFANEAIVGNIGNNFWRRFILHFDFAHNLLFVSANENISEPWRNNRIGASFEIEEGKYLLATIITQSPAAAAGIEKGDELLMIDGEDVSVHSLEDISLKFCESAGTVYKLKIRKQDEKEIDIDVTLQDYIPRHNQQPDLSLSLS